MRTLFDLLYYGGLMEKHQQEIYSDIEASNRKSVIAYSAISVAAFAAMTMFSALDQNAVSKNKLFYALGTLIMLGVLLLNLFASQKYRRVVPISGYLFVVTLLGIGIMLAVSSKEDVTASYMVFLFVAPLLFTLRPLYVILIILASDLLYICYMHRVQAPELFQKNIVNAVIYGILSVFVSTVMIRMRVQKFETDHKNRLLMETDQLTGMLNRHSFSQYIERFQITGSVTGMKVCAFDVNGLKQVNDNLGHHAGDELIRGAAACLQNAFSGYGYCYRIGGDEFIAILPGASPTEVELWEMLSRQTMSFRGTYVPGLSISAGIVTGMEEDNIADLLRMADEKMYADKAAYYEKSGLDRRRHPQAEKAEK